MKREHTFGIIMEAQKFQVITLTVLLLCAIFGVTQGVSAEITEEKEGNSGKNFLDFLHLYFKMNFIKQ